MKLETIKAIIGLGNPGQHYARNRHNVGFRIVDALAEKFHGAWHNKNNMEIAEVMIGGKKVLLIKPQTFMNSSGSIIPFLLKQGIKPGNFLVVHDELELPFGTIKTKFGGSHRGHNGLKSIIAACGDQFARLRFGIGRPERKEDVARYVLQNFEQKEEAEVDHLIGQAVDALNTMLV